MQGYADLLLIEVDIILPDDLLVGDGVDVKQVLANLAADQIVLDDLLDVGYLDRVVKGVFGEYLDEGALRAEAEAADVVDGHLVLQPMGLDLVLEGLLDVDGGVGDAAGPAADDHGALAVGPLDLGVERLSAGIDLLLKRFR